MPSDQQTNAPAPERFPHRKPGREKEYHGEWYIPEMPEEDYANFRTREKGYAAIAMILHVIIGFLPSMGLNMIYTAAAYMAGLLLILYITFLAYRSPSDLTPKTHAQYVRQGPGFRVLTNVQRILVILTLLLDVVATYTVGLGISVWFILQILLLLLEALDLQFLFRMQRKLGWEVTTKS